MREVWTRQGEGRCSSGAAAAERHPRQVTCGDHEGVSAAAVVAGMHLAVVPHTGKTLMAVSQSESCTPFPLHCACHSTLPSSP